ncbi:hypothetical protein GCM10023185_03720 [Hymenobacter saemangeumensis]|uniref:Uncharacterized protein n=1 Tax=Hymenobacter saemangeumensis TaxID=1084522 RepID=A0ABP8HZN6_9BACT
MGFLGLIPADELAAAYNTQTKTLTLFATGEVQDYTYGITFAQVPLMGGLKFQLEGWTGPLHDSKSPYTHEQNFSIQLPSPVAPSGQVIIADANHPEGVAVEVRFLGLLPPGESQPAPQQAVATAAPAMVPGHEQLNVLFKMPFLIKEAAAVPQGGSIAIKFDSTMLELQQAGIEGSNIAWTLNSLQTGNTQVVVSVFGGIAQYVLQKVYDVRVFVLDEVQNSSPAPQAILSFLGRVNIAVRLVQDQYPDAALYEVEALPPSPRSCTNPNELSKLKVVFQAGKGTVIIESTGWGTFGPVQYIAQPWMEDVVIPWPVRMEATEADSLLKKAGYTGAYGAMTLRHPLYPGINQPYYIFSMKTGQYVFVGVNDKKVSVNPVGQAIPVAEASDVAQAQEA